MRGVLSSLFRARPEVDGEMPSEEKLLDAMQRLNGALQVPQPNPATSRIMTLNGGTKTCGRDWSIVGHEYMRLMECPKAKVYSLLMIDTIGCRTG